MRRSIRLAGGCFEVFPITTSISLPRYTAYYEHTTLSYNIYKGSSIPHCDQATIRRRLYRHLGHILGLEKISERNCRHPAEWDNNFGGACPALGRFFTFNRWRSHDIARGKGIKASVSRFPSSLFHPAGKVGIEGSGHIQEFSTEILQPFQFASNDGACHAPLSLGSIMNS